METAYAAALALAGANPWQRRSAIPLNRLETRTLDLLASLGWARHDSLAELKKAFQELTGRQIVFCPSGQSAIAQILSLLPQREVVVPAYTCGVVKAAAHAAGKRIIYVDLAEGSVNSTSAEFAEAARPGRVLLATHQFGVPTDIEAICELAKRRDCIVIEDSVAAFGGSLHGCPLGTFGDFGIFSFQRGKRIPAFRGAAIVVNNDRILETAKLESVRLAASHRSMPFRELLETFIYNFASIPWIYGRFTVPRLLRRYRKRAWAQNNQADSDTDLAAEIALAKDYVQKSPYYTQELHPYQAELVLRMLGRMRRIQQRITQAVETYIRTLRNSPWKICLSPACDYAGLLRLPIVLPSRNRAHILRDALERGLYLEVEYENLLPSNSEHLQFPNAVWAAANLILLPLYAALSAESVESLAQRVAELAIEGTAVEQMQFAPAVAPGQQL